MSYPLDEAAQEAALDAMLGDGAAASMPTAFEMALFDGDPDDDESTELTSDGGYARAAVDNDSVQWPDATGGAKIGAEVVFDESTGEYSDLAVWWLLYDAADSTTRWFKGQLADPIDVPDTGYTPKVTPRVYWNTAS